MSRRHTSAEKLFRAGHHHVGHMMMSLAEEYFGSDDRGHTVTVSEIDMGHVI